VKQIQFAMIFLAIKGVQQVAASRNHGATSSDLFMNAIFRDVVLPLSVTVGSYVVASIIHVGGLRFEDYEWALNITPH
jgi:chitin synthase